MQAQVGFEREGMIRSFVKTVQTQGIRGLYRLVFNMYSRVKGGVHCGGEGGEGGDYGGAWEAPESLGAQVEDLAKIF